MQVVADPTVARFGCWTVQTSVSQGKLRHESCGSRQLCSGCLSGSFSDLVVGVATGDYREVAARVGEYRLGFQQVFCTDMRRRFTKKVIFQKRPDGGCALVRSHLLAVRFCSLRRKEPFQSQGLRLKLFSYPCLFLKHF